MLPIVRAAFYPLYLLRGALSQVTSPQCAGLSVPAEAWLWRKLALSASYPLSQSRGG